MLQFTIDSGKCIRCGQCVADCPSRIIEREGSAVPAIAAENAERCIGCQHCLAVCPTGALSIFGRDPERSLPLAAGTFPDPEQMIALVRGRRSVRRYRDENADRALLQRLLAALANAPSGVNRRGLTFHVIDDKSAMQRFRLRALKALAEAEQSGRVPPQFGYLIQAVPAWFDHGVDMIFRGAPHLLVVSAGAAAACPQEDVNLALAYFELLAQCAGLGTVWCGMAKMTLEVLPDLKPVLGLPPDRFYYCMLFGPPAFHYARSVQRDDAATVHRVTL